MEKLKLTYLKEHFSDTDKFIELEMKNGKDTILIYKDKKCTIVNLIIGKDKNKKKIVKSHEVIDEFTLLTNEKVIKDKFVLSSKYNLNGKIIEIMDDESKIQFEELLVENGNTIENTNRKFINKIVGFRTKKVWKMVLSSLIYLMLLGSVINMFTDDSESEDKKQHNKKEMATKADKNNTDNKKTDESMKESKKGKNADKNNNSKISTQTSDKPKKDLTPEQKLARNIKNNVGKEHFKDVVLREDGDKIIIFLQNYDAITSRGQIKSMDEGIVKSLLQLKKSDINVSNIEITVMQDVQTQKLKDVQAVALRTTWDPETVENLNKDNKADVLNNTKDYAEEYHLNKNIK